MSRKGLFTCFCATVATFAWLTEIGELMISHRSLSFSKTLSTLYDFDVGSSLDCSLPLECSDIDYSKLTSDFRSIFLIQRESFMACTMAIATMNHEMLSSSDASSCLQLSLYLSMTNIRVRRYGFKGQSFWGKHLLCWISLSHQLLLYPRRDQGLVRFAVDSFHISSILNGSTEIYSHSNQGFYSGMQQRS